MSTFIQAFQHWRLHADQSGGSCLKCSPEALISQGRLKHCCCSVAAPWLSCKTGSWVPVPQSRSSAHLRPSPRFLLLLGEFLTFLLSVISITCWDLSGSVPSGRTSGSIWKCRRRLEVPDRPVCRDHPVFLVSLECPGCQVGQSHQSHEDPKLLWWRQKKKRQSRHFWNCPTGVVNQMVNDLKSNSNKKPGCPGGPGEPGWPSPLLPFSPRGPTSPTRMTH